MDKTLYCGLDLQKRSSCIIVKDNLGCQVIKGQIENNENEISNFFAPLPSHRIKVAMEVTSNYYWMFEMLDNLYREVNPAASRTRTK